MNIKELQAQINNKIAEEKKIPLEQVLDSYLKREGFIHEKDLGLVLKDKEKASLIFKKLKNRLPEITIELCSACEGILNYYKERRKPYIKCPKCNHPTTELIKTNILINYHYLTDDRKTVLIEDLKEKIKNLHLDESIYELTNQDQEIIVNFLNKQY